MICKECGAYNPDHATYCKVCAANLKGDPTPETVDEPVEDVQPTKRFSRPSWVMPEQVKKADPVQEQEETVDAPEETEQEVVEEPAVHPVKSVRVPEPEEEPDDDDPDSYEHRSEHPIWTPTRSAKRAVEDDDDDEDEDDNEPSEESELEEDSIYNDEEALEQDDDSFEYEPTPPKRKNKKKKSNTLFTVLLIAIIVVIVAILVAGGLFVLSRSGVLKCGSENGGSVLSCAGSKQANTETDLPIADDTQSPVETPDAQQPDEKTATLQEWIDEEGKEKVSITVLCPAHATVTIACPHQADYVKTNDKDTATRFKISFDSAVFYPNEPLETATVSMQPDVKITTAQGETYQVECPSFDKTFPQLSISLTYPVAKEDGSVMAAEGNVVHFEGKVDQDSDVTLTINDVGTTVYQGGVFMYEYSMSGEAAETVELVASKVNYVTATKTITVDPYVFIPDPMVLDVNDDVAALRADKSGKLTVTGTTLPGAELTATSDDTTRVFCGTVNVEQDGKFSFTVTMDASFYGVSTITLKATKEGAEDGSTSFIVSRSYADKDAFVSAYSKTKSYKQVNIDVTMQELLADLGTYATNSLGYRILATFNEVTPDGYVKMTIVKTNEVVYVRNMSSKWNPVEAGLKYNVWCNFVGTYQDTGCAEFIGWFGKNKK